MDIPKRGEICVHGWVHMCIMCSWVRVLSDQVFRYIVLFFFFFAFFGLICLSFLNLFLKIEV